MLLTDIPVCVNPAAWYIKSYKGNLFIVKPLCKRFDLYPLFNKPSVSAVYSTGVD